MTRGIENSAVINNVKLFTQIINRSHVLLHRFFPLNDKFMCNVKMYIWICKNYVSNLTHIFY